MEKETTIRRSKGIALVLALMCLVSILGGCHLYDGEYRESGDCIFKLNDRKEYCMLCIWKWDGDLDNTVIEVPDEIDGIVVDALGGPTGTNAPIAPFHIETDCDVKFKGTDPEQYDMEVSFEEVVFTLKIGKNIQSISSNISAKRDYGFNYVGIEQDDGSVIFYRILFKVECSKNNEKFYSKKGKLYESKDDKRVDSLPHPDDVKDKEADE